MREFGSNFGLPAVAVLLLVAACDPSKPVLGDEPETCKFPLASAALRTPPNPPPTHHVAVEGRVLDAAGNPLADVAVEAWFACQSAWPRQVSVFGATRTLADGTYRFTAGAYRPREGEVDFNVLSSVPGTNGQPVREAAVLVSARFVPIDQAPPVIRAPDLHIPGPALVAEGGFIVRFLNLEGGCWTLTREEHVYYQPINLPDEFKQDGLRVRVDFTERPDMASICMVGPIVEIRSIEAR